MESRIEELLEKYWNGKTSREEEKIIKTHFQSNPSLNKEADYFRLLKKEQNIRLDKNPNKKYGKTWLSAAATIIIGVLTAILVLQKETDPFAEEDPEKALEATKKVLMMFSSGLNEGSAYTMELTKINKAKEQLTEKEPDTL